MNTRQVTTRTDAFDQLRGFLKKMFQFGDNDLDFGIYRITRLKRQFIEAFIDGTGENSLRATVTRALASVQNRQLDTARNWLAAFSATMGKKGEAAWKTLADAPADAQALAGFQKLLTLAEDDEREQAEAHLKLFTEAADAATEDLEARVYNHLLNFFELYYANGDFGYNTRAASAFKVPYEADYDGSDTLFHWKHKDSYYIKTGNGFHSVRFEMDGQWLEFCLVAGGDEEAETATRNNIKDNEHKHYRLTGIEKIAVTTADGMAREIWQVRFVLAAASTPKTEIYPALWQAVFDADIDLVPYLHKKPDASHPAPGQAVFNDLADDYDKADGGRSKGLGQLRLKQDDYLKALAKRDEFKALGSNADQREKALEQDATAGVLWQIDRRLNQFYAGNDADYFIHKDLQGFLGREKARFIKNVVFSDLGGLLHAGEDNLVTLIARAFNQVADTLIGFLAAIENFQKSLFELKKKVVDTHYLISVSKIPGEFHARVTANASQLREWQDLYKVEISKPGELAEHPSLVVDTGLYRDNDPDFQAELLSHPAFDHLHEQTDGLLINSENWQALNLLQESFRERIKCIYIDPPYNTGGDGFLYKDSFRHSSWASMIHDRLVLAHPLLAKNGVLFASIDEKERVSLERLLTEEFGDQNRLGELIWNNVTDNNPTRIATEHEYIEAFSCDVHQVSAEWKSAISDAKDALVAIGSELIKKYGDTPQLRKAYKDWFKENKRFLGKMDRYKYIDAGGVYTGSQSVHNPGKEGYRYDVPFKGDASRPCKQPLMGYRFPWETMKKLLDEDRILFGKDETKLVELKVYASEYVDKLSSVITLDGRSGANDLRAMFPGEKRFKNPKASQLLEGIFPFVVDNGEYVMDFFAGSGTTAQSVLALNRKDKARRKFVLTEMGEYFDIILKPRVAKVMASSRWNNGAPGAVADWQGIVKVQRLEQYEDTLDNLEPVWDDAELPTFASVRYLFRPEEQALHTSLDLSRPFAQTLRTGKARVETAIDVAETWCYLQGHVIRSRRRCSQFERPYEVVETTHGVLVVLRDIDPAEDDTDTLKAILAAYVDEDGASRIQRLEVNFDADLRHLAGIDTQLIHADDFLRGTTWS